MIKWEDIKDNNKKLLRCQKLFKEMYTARNHYNEAKEQTQNIMNKITDTKWNLYINAMDAQTKQDKKEHNEHIQQLSQQSATLMTLVQA